MENPPPLKQWLREHHLIKQTFDRVHGEIIAEEKAITLTDIKEAELARREAADMLGDMVTGDDDKWKKVEQEIYNRAMAGTVKAQELYAKLKGKLKDEVELKIGLSADEIARRNLIAERELEPGREAGHRVEEVQEEPPLLPE